MSFVCSEGASQEARGHGLVRSVLRLVWHYIVYLCLGTRVLTGKSIVVGKAYIYHNL